MQQFPRSVALRGAQGLRIHSRVNCRRTFASTQCHRAEGETPSSSRDAPAPKPGDSAMIRQEGPSEGQPRHNPDYNVAVDYRTSAFSPIPMRVMDGSEPGDTVPAAVLSGAPIDLQARTVR
ncbi:MAG: hypothetical protein M1820_000997 [Bogoriella megaspora]|nr:MAG: hypothetical protein M1820_000997 [Bogoriella megaspora]